MRILTASAGIVLILDQVSKYLVVHTLQLDQKLVIHVWPPWLSFRMAWNTGVNFGLFSNSAQAGRWFLIVLALAISVWVWNWVRPRTKPWVLRLSGGLLIGGALGNVVDRLAYGAVADFLNMSVPGLQNPYSFNVADLAIFLGAAGLVIFSGKDKTP